MTTVSGVESGIIIPQDICSIICRDADLNQRDLVALCAVSRLFCAEAARVLYFSVELPCRGSITSFCTTVTRHPSLAATIRKLVFVMPPESHVEPDLLSLIPQILYLSTGLRELHILRPRGHDFDDATESWILGRHTFKLTTFVNTYLRSDCLCQFLESQPMIETLVVDKDVAALEGITFSNLKNLSCTQDLGSIPSTFEGALKRLQIHIKTRQHYGHMRMLFSHIGIRFSKTLKNLSVVVHSSQILSLLGIQIGAVVSLPDLQFLEIVNYSGTSKFPTVFSDTSCFTQLATLIIRSPIQHCNCHTGNTMWIDLCSKESRLSTATHLTRTIPTLTRLLLCGPRESYEYNIRLGEKPTSEIIDSCASMDYLGLAGNYAFAVDEWLDVQV